ncbi:MAG TPA: methionine--tRNA ligase [Candidatus Saccharimonadales bacterium]|nr:methionine--tRNA ligase [Candidatus Saccharimonadales bacterium]
MSNFYITTSIPYVNGEPHIGHAYEFLAADVIARYMRQYKAPVIFSTGTDEHGGKIAEKAAELHITPKQLTDQNSAAFAQLLKELNISNDRFIRTTDAGHIKRAQKIWKDLDQFIYKGSYEGWYCTGCETFYSEKVVQADKGVCPLHDKPYEKLKEENYFFRLSNFAPKVKEAIESDLLRIVPLARKHEILNVIDAGLEDISISRPKDKISWGIPVPGDPSQVMYVWFEALMNYITVLGYPEHKDFKEYWPANIQLIGKDILRFHAAIWPAMLIGLNLPLPKVLYVHGFITVGDTKMSKTLGNVIAPKQIIERYGVEAFRYFFMRHIPSYEDGDFTWERLDAAYNSELADQLGNAVSRIAAMIKNYQKGVIGDIPEAEHDIGPYKDAIENCRFDKALDEVWEQVRGLNQYIEETKPWEVAKAGDADHLREVLSAAVGSLLEIAILLTPFMPDTAAKIQATFGSGVLKELDGPLFPKSETTKNA